MSFIIKHYAKAWIAGLVSALAVWLAQNGIDVPADAQKAMVEVAIAIISGIATGGMTFAIPNAIVKTKKVK